MRSVIQMGGGKFSGMVLVKKINIFILALGQISCVWKFFADVSSCHSFQVQGLEISSFLDMKLKLNCQFNSKMVMKLNINTRHYQLP